VIFDRLTGQKVGVRIKNHPATVVSNNCWRLVQTFCSDLGLSIVARQRLSVEAGDTQTTDELLDLLQGPRAQRPKDDDEKEPVN